ncbi:lamin tail domain-containing protein [Longispora sp. K20-0274]|uniref:lamin tail domain-containing protein n=1 Tax=Longispora sp. K20-0274 TaxID=3088255 RepID=UPI00399A56D1
MTISYGRILAGAAATAIAATALTADPALAASPDVVISQVYGGGGNSGATYTTDYIELTNRGTSPVSVDGWSVQYAAAAGTSWARTLLTGTIAPGASYLVAEAPGAGGTTPLPTPNVTGTIAMSATAGKVALVTNGTALTCGAVCHAAVGVRDFVGYGTANDFEGTAGTPALSNSTAALRQGVDTDNNSVDFVAGAPTPGSGGIPPVPPPTAARVHEIQGRGHRSPLVGKAVITSGVVTAVAKNGFWIQDTAPDADPATSEGIFVFTGGLPTVVVGDCVDITAKVSEFRPGNAATNLSTTELTSPKITVTAQGVALPEPVLIGRGGILAPTPVRADLPGDVEASATFDPTANALDFYEALEGMRLRLVNPKAVGPTTSNGEIAVEAVGADDPRTERNGVRYDSYAVSNTDRVILDDLLAPMPAVNVCDTLKGNIDGVLDYSFGNYKLLATATPEVLAGNLQREVTRAATSDELAIATYNVENLAPSDPQAKFDRLAHGIVDNLAGPDILAIEEIQDNSGSASDGTVSATVTWQKLIDAIVAAGGAQYSYRSIDPVNNSDGGQPGGNIRTGFLFRTDKGLSFVDRPGGDATTPVGVTAGASGGAALTLSPGRIDPANAVWEDSRKPLAGEFVYRGKTYIVVANHFASKGGDDPMMGRFQPPTRSSETKRHGQATAVRSFVDSVRAIDAKANIVVLGDLNDFQFSDTANILVGDGFLVDLPQKVTARQSYTYVYDGNSQVLDHILLSKPLYLAGEDYDIVHINSEFADQESDHDPQVIRLATPQL